MTGIQRIIAETILDEISKEFRISRANMIVQHVGALILSETFFTMEETADLLIISLEQVLDNVITANNVFRDNKPYRLKIYSVITNMHDTLSFSKSKKQRRLITKSDLPGVKICSYNSFYDPRRNKRSDK